MLLVDDEEMVLDVGSAILELGYRVLTASGGRGSGLRQQPRIISLVVLDMIMPDLGAEKPSRP